MTAVAVVLDPTVAAKAVLPVHPTPKFRPPLAQAAYYPPHWPSVPFHKGEVALQKLQGVHDRVMSYAPRVIRPYLPPQHRDFFQAQPMMVAAARDGHGQLWATLLQNQDGTAEGFITSPDPTHLEFHNLRIPRSDALYGQLRENSDLGLLGIELATRRRNRVNGRVVASNDASAITFQVDQSFGNCPQYIVPRQWWSSAAGKDEDQHDQNDDSTPTLSNRSTELSPEQMEQIRSTDTIFIATGYRGVGDDVRYGNDASHRGGTAGSFVQVVDSKTLVIPEFAGNNHYNSLGNLQMDNRMGVTIPHWEHGGLLQLTGTATVHLNADEAAKVHPGAKALVTFTILQVNVVPNGTLPLRWKAPVQKRKAKVIKKVVESTDVTSFYLHAPDNQPVWSFQPGQHLPITLITREYGELERTYSLSDHSSSFSMDGSYHYRITVKREPQGKASRWLHDRVQVGDEILISPPAGDFVLEQQQPKEDAVETNNKDKTTVLLSMGVGITPMVPMLQELVQRASNNKVVWIHGARNGAHDALRAKVDDLESRSQGRVQAYHVYSQPTIEDNGSYTHQGHVDPAMVQKLVPDLDQAEFYMCGTGAFTANLEQGLEDMGVDPQAIHSETF